MQKRKELVQKLTACWVSCITFMVQGNLSLITTTHTLIAFRASVGALILYVLSTRLFKKMNPIQESSLLAVVMSFTDVLTHPTHFGHWYTEAISTGIAAGLINYFLVLLLPAKQR